MLADRRFPDTWTSGYAAVIASSVKDRSSYFSLCPFLFVSFGRAVVPTLRPRYHHVEPIHSTDVQTRESMLGVTLSETFAITAVICSWIARETLRSLHPVIPREILSRIPVLSFSRGRSFLPTVPERHDTHSVARGRNTSRIELRCSFVTTR